MSIEKHRAFIDSLEGEKCESCLGTGGFTRDGDNNEFDDNYEIIECAECGGAGKITLKIPNLKERVKELLRDAMDAEKDSYETDGSVDFEEAGKRVEAFRTLCAEVKP